MTVFIKVKGLVWNKLKTTSKKRSSKLPFVGLIYRFKKLMNEDTFSFPHQSAIRYVFMREFMQIEQIVRSQILIKQLTFRGIYFYEELT